MVPTDDPPSTGDQTRREVLRGGAGLLATGIATLTAGCTGSLPPLGSPQQFGRVDVPPADPSEYRRWLPAPSAVGAGERPPYPFLFRRPGALDYPAPVRFTTPRKRLLAELDYFGVGYANYDRLLRTELGTVLAGGFDSATVTDSLTSSGYHTDGRYQGHERFVRSDVRRQAIVTDDAIVWSSRRVHERPNIEALVDAREGRVPRYHEENEAYRRLSDVIGESRMVEFIPPDGERRWTKLEGFRFDGDVAYHLMTFLYPEGMAVPEDELRERSIDRTVLTREVDNADLRIDGQLAVFEGRIPPGEGISPAEIHPPYPPQITWGFTRDDTEETITITHEAGASVPTDDLHLGFEADVADELWSIPETRPLPTVLEELKPGDSVTVNRQDIPDVSVIHPDDIDWGAEDQYAASEPRPATRIELRYAPANGYRPVFAIELEGEA